MKSLYAELSKSSTKDASLHSCLRTRLAESAIGAVARGAFPFLFMPGISEVRLLAQELHRAQTRAGLDFTEL